jgi:NAD+ synthase (glutamine-hydrolysing)
MPGFATTEGTKSNAWALMKELGVDAREIDIKPMANADAPTSAIPSPKGEKVYDITFENVQAGLRTDYLFRLANQEDAAWSSAPATSPSWRWAGAPMAWATT